MSGLAAEIAFFGILGLFPSLLALAAALGSLEGLIGASAARRAEDAVVDTVAQIFTSEADQTVDAVRSLFTDDRSGLLTFSLLLTVYAMSRGFVGVIRALDQAYDIEEHRSWFAIRANAIALAVGSLLIAVVALLMLILGPLLGGGRDVAELVGLGDAFVVLWQWARAPATFLALVLWATTLYHVAPNRSKPWLAEVPGAVLAATSWVLASLGFRLYLDVAAQGNQVFGLLGGALIVLFWLYLLGIGLLVGAELNSILLARYHWRGHVDAPDEPPSRP